MKPSVQRLATHAQNAAAFDLYYDRIVNARDAGKHLAWVMAATPSPFLLAANVVMLVADNYPPMAAQRGVGAAFIERAEEAGYYPELCSYARLDWGSLLSDDAGGPLGKRPKPDFTYTAMLCSMLRQWFAEVARLLGVPSLILDTPFQPDETTAEERKQIIAYVYGQLKEHAAFLQQLTGTFDHDKLAETMVLGKQAIDLYTDIIRLGTRKPSPLTVFDVLLTTLPLLLWHTGYPEAISYLSNVKAEIEARVANRQSAVGEERFRVLFEGIPPWFALGTLPRILASHGVCAVSASTYAYTWCDYWSCWDPSRPLESIAEGQVGSRMLHGTKYRIEKMKQLVEEYALDGLVLHIPRTCKLYNQDQLVVARAVRQEMGVPFVVIEGDMVDERFYDHESATTNLESFIESLDKRPRSI